MRKIKISSEESAVIIFDGDAYTVDELGTALRHLNKERQRKQKYYQRNKERLKEKRVKNYESKQVQN